MHPPSVRFMHTSPPTTENKREEGDNNYQTIQWQLHPVLRSPDTKPSSRPTQRSWWPGSLIYVKKSEMWTNMAKPVPKKKKKIWCKLIIVIMTCVCRSTARGHPCRESVSREGDWQPDWKKKPVSISKSAGPRHCFNVNCTGHGIKIFRFMDKGTSRAEFKDHFKTRGILFPTSDA